MSVALQIQIPPVWSPSSPSCSYSSSYQCRASPLRVNCCSRSVVVQEALPSQTKSPSPSPPPNVPPAAGPDEDGRDGATAEGFGSRSGIKVPRQRHISVSKSELLDAIVSGLFPSQEEARQFLSLSQCLDLILHAEHKTILEEMRADFDVALSGRSSTFSLDDFQSIRRKIVVNQDSGSCKNNSNEKEQEYKSEASTSSDFTLDFVQFLDFSFDVAKKNLIKSSRVPIPSRFQRTFMKLLSNAEFEELSTRDLILASALNTDYLLTVPIYVDWKKASESSTIIFRRGYAMERQEGLLIGNLKGLDTLSSDFPIWVAAQKAVTRYEGILKVVGPREKLFRKFLAWIGLVPSTPKQSIDLDMDNYESEAKLSSSFLSRISLSDIWKPASPKYCGNDVRKMLRTAISILFSQSILQEPAFQELILLYTEENGERETTNQTEVPSLQMKIYEKIPIPDLPVVFPHKKLSFRILDTVRLDAASILGLLAYFFSYKFEDILSSPSAIILDFIAATALVIYVFRVVLGYKLTRDRYQLLVNRTLYEKTVASGFGSIHFLLDASEQQLYKEAILAYAMLLKAENSQEGTCARSVGEKCEQFLDNVFQEKMEMPIEKAMKTLKRLGLAVDKVAVGGHIVVQAVPFSEALTLLQNLWNTLI
ncbi:uncharacterized protein LOC127240252 isoform X2 [Andrographis paniculata]|uniref:uncharacterized protein LOC127240252 isoform X2 n=1 Tax=Andrographis paniculata TaxID=175694 RepID=UPI0021E8CABE|nr:uncharacterized protein LOC127240252 isoform X2 [Andrographis paniculata]